MTDTLFDLPDSPSPRLQWMRRHGVTVEMDSIVFHYAAKASGAKAGFGFSELEALTDFAINNNLKLWNEE